MANPTSNRVDCNRVDHPNGWAQHFVAKKHTDPGYLFTATGKIVEQRIFYEYGLYRDENDKICFNMRGDIVFDFEGNMIDHKVNSRNGEGKDMPVDIILLFVRPR